MCTSYEKLIKSNCLPGSTGDFWQVRRAKRSPIRRTGCYWNRRPSNERCYHGALTNGELSVGLGNAMPGMALVATINKTFPSAPARHHLVISENNACGA